MEKKSAGGQKRKARKAQPPLAKIIPIRPKSSAKRVPHLPNAAVTLQQFHEKLAALETDILTLLAARGTTAGDAARALVGVLVKLVHMHRLPVDELIIMALVNRQMLSMVDVNDPENAG